MSRRTHGGAVLTGLSSHEDSFFKRLEEAVEEKERLASATLACLSAGDAVFLDCSTTAYFLARRIARDNFRSTLLTNAVPVMDLVCEAGVIEPDLARGWQAECVWCGAFSRSLVSTCIERSTRNSRSPHT